MEWRKSYLDVILVPSSLLLSILYHGWLWRKVRSQPQLTEIGINSAARQIWVIAMMKNNCKNCMLVVQTIRNAIMGSTLMATTSILLSSGLAAIVSSTYNVKKPLESSIYGAHGEFMEVLKYIVLLHVFLFAFLCYSLSIRFMNQVSFLINIPHGDEDEASLVTPEYVCCILEKGFVLHIVGNRLFYAALPLILWIFGPVLVFLCSVVMVTILYNTDIVYGEGKCRVGGIVDKMGLENYIGV